MSDADIARDRGDESGTGHSRRLRDSSAGHFVSGLDGLVRSAHLGIGAVYLIAFTAVVAVLLVGGACWTLSRIGSEAHTTKTRSEKLSSRARKCIPANAWSTTACARPYG